MRKRRIVFMSLVLLTFFSMIFIRTGYLLLKDTSNISIQVNSQVTNKSKLYFPRGKIYDRNMIPISGRVSKDTIPVPDYNATVGELIVGKLESSGEIITDTTEGGLKGISGLQSLYNEKLIGGTPIKIALYSDATGERINEESIMVYDDHINEGESLVTTLDYHLQKLVEKKLDNTIKEKNYKGVSVVITQVKSGEILTMASVGNQTNKALLCYQPGSTFKILVAAKALELGKVDLDTIFHCDGSIEINGTTKYCYKKDGHQDISFLDAFAQSCNITFYQTALMLQDEENRYSNEVLDLAKEFGFQNINEDEEYEKEFMLSSDYSFPLIPEKIFNNMDVFNLALGQGKIMASPLTMNKIVGTIANDGVLIEPQLIKQEIDFEGNISEEYTQSEKQIFTKDVNDKLKLLLEEVAKTGTGKNNTLIDRGGLAGKSGTAQHVEDKENHAWFTGYFPADNPTYAMTVFVEEGGVSSQEALPIYNEIANEILDLYP